MKIGFIGCGNMATAILKGILKSGEVAAADIIASAKSDKTREKIEKELGIQKAVFCRVNEKLYQFSEELDAKGISISKNAIDWLEYL